MNKELRLKLLAEQALLEVEALGIKHNKIDAFVINTRAKTRFGQCKRRDNRFTINISSFILDESVSDIRVKNVIIHEILHTVEGCFNHGEEWKRMADKVNRAYPCYSITRTESMEDFGLNRDEINPPKYILKCKGCGQTIKRQKSSKLITRYDLYSCGKCGCKFERIK